MAASPLSVLVSIPPQKYFVERIGGTHVAVTVMVAKGKDPHSYEPTAAQMVSAAKASLYFSIGVPFEAQWLPRLRELNKGLTLVNHTKGLEPLKQVPALELRPPAESAKAEEHHDDDGHDHGLDASDPHIWMSPKVVARIALQIRDALIQARPDKTEEFSVSAAAFIQEVTDLDAKIMKLFAPLPEEKRTFLTLHQSWGYFAQAYGLHEMAVELEGKEPGPKGMARLTALAKTNSIRVLLADAMANRNTVASVASGIGGTVVQAFPLAERWDAELWRMAQALSQAMLL